MSPEKFYQLYKSSTLLLPGGRGYSLPEEWEGIWALALHSRIKGLAHGVDREGHKFVVTQTNGIDIYYEGRPIVAPLGGIEHRVIYCANKV